MSACAFHPLALADLVEIHRFMAEGSLEAADSAVKQIFDKLNRIAQMPYTGHARPDLGSRQVRFAHVYDYLIVYVPDRKPIWVVAVLHGRRNPFEIARVLRERN